MRKAKWIFFLLLMFTGQAHAMLFGNPAQPTLQSEGVFHKDKNGRFSFRAAYIGDYVYREKYRDEFRLGSLIDSPTYVKLWTEATLVTMNFNRRLDLYGIVGASQLQVDKEIFTQQELAWGIGGKIIIFHHNSFRVGLDLKYFETDQEPLFLVADGLPYNVVGDFTLQYQEIQGALGLSYKTGPIAPYAYLSYVISKINPHPMMFLVRLPFMDMVTDVLSKSVINRNRWGFAIGATIIAGKKSSFTIESRMINQNGIDVSGEIRF